MKSTIFLLTAILFWGASGAQGVFSNQTNYTLEKVIQDYPSQFKNIRGELLSSRPGAAEYKSIIAIPGAVSTTITQSGAAHKQNVSWQAVLYAGNEFMVAKNRFEELFAQIKNTILKSQGEKPVIISGQYKNPSEDKSSTTISFDLLPASGFIQKLNIDLVLKNTDSQWRIILSVYDKELKEADSIVVK